MSVLYLTLSRLEHLLHRLSPSHSAASAITSSHKSRHKHRYWWLRRHRNIWSSCGHCCGFNKHLPARHQMTQLHLWWRQLLLDGGIRVFSASALKPPAPDCGFTDSAFLLQLSVGSSLLKRAHRLLLKVWEDRTSENICISVNYADKILRNMCLWLKCKSPAYGCNCVNEYTFKLIHVRLNGPFHSCTV